MNPRSVAIVLAPMLAACSACGGPGVTGTSEPAPAASGAPSALPTGTASSSAPSPAGSGTSTGTDAGSTATDGGHVTPAGLACLAKYYAGTVVGDALKLPDGTMLAWDDGKTKTYDQTLDDPDLEDVFSIPYTMGPIVPISAVNHDPGRIRSDALLKATFGATEAEVQSKLVNVTFVGQTVTFHQKAAAALGRVSQRLTGVAAAAPYVTGTLGGTFNWRPIANTTRMSAHSYGIAIDINVSKSNYWEWEKQNGQIVWANKIPQVVVDAFEAEGFAWGGRWYHYDTMHFEYRPELFDPACR